MPTRDASVSADQCPEGIVPRCTAGLRLHRGKLELVAEPQSGEERYAHKVEHCGERSKLVGDHISQQSVVPGTKHLHVPVWTSTQLTAARLAVLHLKQ